MPGLVVAALMAGAVVLGCGCGRSPGGTPGPSAAQRASFLAAVHTQDPTVGQLRTDPQLLRLGSAACAGFAAGASFFSLADTMAVGDGGLPASDLGTVIKAAAEQLCPLYRSRVS